MKLTNKEKTIILTALVKDLVQKSSELDNLIKFSSESKLISKLETQLTNISNLIEKIN